VGQALSPANLDLSLVKIEGACTLEELMGE
jgi:hypothetical protein